MCNLADNRGSRGNLIVLSGPSGVGKGTICRELLKKCPDLTYSVSATTRKMRPGETDGREYFFYNVDEFLHLVKKGAFLEWARVYDNYYGTPREFVEKITGEGKDCILEIDVQGALQVKREKPEGVFIFIAPPSKEELVRRITGRGTEDKVEIKKRLDQADGEMAHLAEYDYLVVNDEVSLAVARIQCIITAERCRVHKKSR
ncbi:MAG: guanylate kinase [Peptococcaceae bacterium]|jgi:guanylate kinase|nr:guanylate kinase [Peptococcaceae bacterium]MDH7524298.1 guanylate kinase [Peptococcaceae bacterium]